MNRIVTIVIGLMFLSSCSNVTEDKKDSITDTLQHKAPLVTNTANVTEGPYIKKYSHGTIEILGHYQDGKKEGLWTSFYPSGKKWSECMYNNGIKQGPTSNWYENEKLRYTGNFSNDKESGKWKFWDEKGNLVKETDFD